MSEAGRKRSPEDGKAAVGGGMMRNRTLGKTGISVSPFCFGTLNIGPGQANLSLKDGRDLIAFALECGVNFFDTAELYGTYEFLDSRVLPGLEDAVIASRSFAVTRGEMARSLDLARKSMHRDVVDIFGLHQQESGLTLKGHREALEFLAGAKSRGWIKAVMVSTHHVACVRAASLMDEVDVIFAILNLEGLGIRDGTRQDMEEALSFASSCGKGVYVMKALGGGHLYRRAREALAYVRDLPFVSSVAVGVKSRAEVLFACSVLSGGEVPRAAEAETRGALRRVVVEDWCTGCGECVKVCGFGAVTLESGKAVVDPSKCMLCGYCSRVCPDFSIKVL